MTLNSNLTPSSQNGVPLAVIVVPSEGPITNHRFASVVGGTVIREDFLDALFCAVVFSVART
jgi:hypothetical protein